MAEAIRIFVESGDPEFTNVGDRAMLEVCLERLHGFWLDGRILVTTADPGKLQLVDNAALPVDPADRRHWLNPWSIVGGMHHLVPGPLVPAFARLEGAARRRLPRLSAPWALHRARQRGAVRGVQNGQPFFEALRTCDLVVFSGSGGFNDLFTTDFANSAYLETLEAALGFGKPVWLFGQGVGPVRDRHLARRMARAFCRARMICLREDRAGPELLREWGVPSDRVCVTGDDAIALALRAKRDHLGNALGVNLRVAKYSAVTDAISKDMSRACAELVDELGCDLVPVPIAFGKGNEDEKAIQAVFAACGRPMSLTPETVDRSSPVRAIEAAGRCRVVLTGSYHGAVLSLAQGVPVVCLAANRYYRDKFEGLRGQFGEGCVVVDAASDDRGATVRHKALDLWSRAPNLRDALLASALDQQKRSEAAYRKLFDLMQEGRTP